MKRKILICLLAMILCVLFSACQKETCLHQNIVTTVDKAATCLEAGTMKHLCQDCGVTFTQTTPEGQHDFAEAVTLEATCAQEGVLTRTCKVCGTSENSNLAPISHRTDMYSLTPSLCTVCNAEVEDAANVPGNLWYGKNWVALGTSLTSREQGTYVQPLAERTGLQVTNLGIPGGTAVDTILESAKTADLSNADLITVEFGVNDWFGDIPLGTVGDTKTYVAPADDGSGGEGSFAGACYQIFTTLQKRAPQALVVFLTDPAGQKFDSTGENCAATKRNHLDLLQRDYAETAMDVAAFVGIPAIDAGSTAMINQYHPEYLKDQIHHTELGGQQYAFTLWLELKDMAPLLKAE